MRAEYTRNDEDSYEAVVFDAGSDEQFEIQRSLAPTDADREAGHDTYCLVVAAGATHYGGVDRLEVEGETVSFEFTDAAVEALGVPRRVSVDLDADSLARIQEPLERMLSSRSP